MAATSYFEAIPIDVGAYTQRSGPLTVPPAHPISSCVLKDSQAGGLSERPGQEVAHIPESSAACSRTVSVAFSCLSGG